MNTLQKAKEYQTRVLQLLNIWVGSKKKPLSFLSEDITFETSFRLPLTKYEILRKKYILLFSDQTLCSLSVKIVTVFFKKNLQKEKFLSKNTPFENLAIKK